MRPGRGSSAWCGGSCGGRPREPHVGLALLVARAVGVLDLGEAAPRVEAARLRVALEGPQLEPAGAQRPGTREQRRPGTAALRGRVDVEVLDAVAVEGEEPERRAVLAAG